MNKIITLNIILINFLTVPSVDDDEGLDSLVVVRVVVLIVEVCSGVEGC